MLAHQILGVSPRASAEEITAAYRRLMKILHPDHNQSSDAAERFNEVRRAYKDMQEQSVASRVVITLEDVAVGGRVIGKTIDKCDYCSGVGGTEKYTCTKCFGQKIIWAGNLQKKCSKCEGRGYFFVKLCKVCQGRGVEVRDYPISIPRGVKNGTLLGSTTIEVVPHSRFIRKGLDLHLVEDLSLVDALAGGNVRVELLNEKFVEVKIPSLTDSDYVKKVQGCGLVDESNKRGHLRIRFKIVVPKTLHSTVLSKVVGLLRSG